MTRSMIRPMITSLVNPDDTLNAYRYSLDGIGNYITIPNLPLVGGDIITFKYKGVQPLSNQYIVDTRASGSSQFLIINSGGNVQFSGLTLDVDGVALGNGQAWAFDNGTEHTIKITSTVASDLTKLFVKDTSPQNYLSGEAYDISITCVAGNRFYPVNDGWSNNPVITDTLSGQDGVAINFSEERWSNYISGFWLVTGQSLSIGTLNPAFNTKPSQPQIASNFNMFNQVGSTGVQNRVLVDSDFSSLVPYEEQGESGMSSYYTLGTTLLDGSSTSENTWIPAGMGGASIEDIGLGGAYACYANQQLMIKRISELRPYAKANGIVFIHGGANYTDSKTEYYDKMVTFLANQVSAVQADYIGQVPLMYIYQHGGERIVSGVQTAQLQLSKDELGVCAGATYWLNRQHPNTSDGVNGSNSFERIHLNVLGYQYLGDMFKRSIKVGGSFKPLHVNDYEWVTSSQLKLHVHNPDAGSTLVIDTTQPNIPAFAGNGIEIERPDGSLYAAISVSVSGLDITVNFANDVLIGDRVRIGFTPEDMNYSGPFIPNPTVGSYPSAIVGTNIRGSNLLPASLGNDGYYDWLAVDVIATESKASAPTDTRGNNCWRSGANQGTAGWGLTRVFSGGQMNVTTDGTSVSYGIARDLKSAGSNKEHSTWNIKAGNAYEFSADIAIDTDIAYFQLFIGDAGVNIQKSDIVAGRVTLQLTTTVNFNVMVALRERSGEDITVFTGHLSNIEIREILT